MPDMRHTCKQILQCILGQNRARSSLVPPATHFRVEGKNPRSEISQTTRRSIGPTCTFRDESLWEIPTDFDTRRSVCSTTPSGSVASLVVREVMLENPPQMDDHPDILESATPGQGRLSVRPWATDLPKKMPGFFCQSLPVDTSMQHPDPPASTGQVWVRLGPSNLRPTHLSGNVTAGLLSPSPTKKGPQSDPKNVTAARTGEWHTHPRARRNLEAQETR